MITQEMLDKIPREWIEQADRLPAKRVIPPELIEQIDTMIMMYGNKLSQSTLAEICGCSRATIQDRKKQLQNAGKI